MPDGFVAVIGTAVPAALARFEGFAVSVVRLGSEVAGLLVSDCDDLRVCFRLAETLVAGERAAVVVMCYPKEPYQASWVLRAQRPVHAFLPLDKGQTTAQHYDGAEQSHVEAPLAEGLALAGFEEHVGAAAVCERLGGHAHR